MTVEVVSAEERLFAGEATEVHARSLDGEIGILPGHQPVLLALDIAPVVIKSSGAADVVVSVESGFLFLKDDHLVVLADTAELATDRQSANAEAERKRAERSERDKR